MTLLEASSSHTSYGTLDPEEQMGDREDDRLLYPHSIYDVENDVDTEEDDTPSEGEVQDGVRKIEAISQTWTQRSLMIAYLGWVDEIKPHRNPYPELMCLPGFF
jgi:hypothetical protein